MRENWKRDRGDAAGRRARFERIYDVGYGPILAYALRRAPTPEDAADIVAETFLTAWRRLDEIPELPEARLWLYATARLILANQRRGQQRRQRRAARLRALRIGWSGGAPAGVAVEDRDDSLVAAAFGRLKAADREVLAMAGWEGLTTGEIAGVLGCGADPPDVETSVDNDTYRVGARLLVSGGDLWGSERLTDPVVWYCGFTRTYSQDMADQWRQAFS